MSDEARVEGAVELMTVQTANALITLAPIAEGQLRAAMVHYRALVDLTRISGPAFANAHRQAVQLHDRAVRRLRETLDEARRREVRRAELAEGLVEIGEAGG